MTYQSNSERDGKDIAETTFAIVHSQEKGRGHAAKEPQLKSVIRGIEASRRKNLFIRETVSVYPELGPALWIRRKRRPQFAFLYLEPVKIRSLDRGTVGRQKL